MRENSLSTPIALILASMAAGCLPYTYGLPPVSGRVITSDSTPAAGMAFAVAGHPDGCRKATAHGITNSSGVFDLPSSSADSWIVVIPPIERFANPYWICAGSNDSTLTAVYQGMTPLHGAVAADSVICLEWLWQGNERVTCGPAAHEDGNIISGGAWQDGDTRGSYRLILPSQRDLPRLLVQWVESSHVRAVAAVPLDHGTQGIGDVRLEERGAGRWCVIVVALPHTEAFELGPPGQVNAAKSRYCARDSS